METEQGRMFTADRIKDDRSLVMELTDRPHRCPKNFRKDCICKSFNFSS